MQNIPNFKPCIREKRNSENSNDLFHIYINSSKISKTVIVKVNRKGNVVELKVDTGASLKVINSKTFDIFKSGLEKWKFLRVVWNLNIFCEKIRTQEKPVISIDFESQLFKLLYEILKEINQIYCAETVYPNYF